MIHFNIIRQHINKINMDNLEIEASLRKIDQRFTEQLNKEDKQIAIKQFKHMYAEQMSKLSLQISKRQKVQENLNQINTQGINQAKEIDLQIKKKMEKNQNNREKQKNNKQNELKMVVENWKRKMEEIARKKREKDRESFRKAEKIRKDAQQFWKKKDQISNFKEITKEMANQHQDRYDLEMDNQSLDKNKIKNKRQLSTNFHHLKGQEKKINLLLPNLKNTKIRFDNGPDNIFNQSCTENNTIRQVKTQRQRSIKTYQEREQNNFQKIMTKLDKIERSRQVVQKRLEKEVEDAKRSRQAKLNPQMRKANKKRSLQTICSKSQRIAKSSKEKLKSMSRLSSSGDSLDKSITKHLQHKKKISQHQFKQRQSIFESKMRKIKHGKMNRIIKQAINMIKHQTLK